MTRVTQQFARDFGLPEATFTAGVNRFVTGSPALGTRVWARGAGDLVSYRDTLFVRSTNPAVTAALAREFQTASGAWFFEWPTLMRLETILNRFGWRIENHAPFFLPKGALPTPSDSHLRVIEQANIPGYQADPRIREAFAYDDADPDVLGVGYFDPDLKVVAGANINGALTWEIGIEVLDADYAHRGLAKLVTQALAAAMQRRDPGRLVVYGTQFSHSQSMNVAIGAGFHLGWTELMFGPMPHRH